MPTRPALFPHIVPAFVLGLICVACGGETIDGPGDGSGDAGADVGGGEVTEPEFPPCEDNTDCRGGEVCRGGGCREACSDNDPCAGELGACDVDAGVCVACVADGDCGTNERCDDQQCVFFCTGDRQCAGGEICNTATGECFEPECTQDSDCSGGFTCQTGVCAPIDPVVCEAGEESCDGDVIVRCSRDGTESTRSPCAGDTVCIDDETSVRCAERACEPDSVGCVDVDTAFLCAADGMSLEELPCPSGRSCVSGVCRPQICEPSAVTCDGDSLLVCNETGTSEQNVACAVDPDCAASDFGCTCDDSDCVERICQPGVGQCVGSGTRRCDETGLAVLPIENCGDDESCFAGECLPLECTPGSTLCAANTLLTCTAGGGSRWRETNCESTGAYCDDSGATALCRSRVCEPGASRCAIGSAAAERCNDDGSAFVAIACDASQYCASGFCVADVCAAGATSCIGGNANTCNALGSAYEVTDACTVDEECRAGACQPLTGECSSSLDCPPRASRCEGNVWIRDTASGVCRTRTCDYTGTSQRTTCGIDQACDAAAGCVSTVDCTVDGDCGGGFCVDNTCVECEVNVDCGAGFVCTAAGTCVSGSTSSCTTNQQCRDIAAAQGVATDDVYCDSRVGCVLAGACEDPALGTGGFIFQPNDPFDAPCLSTQTCEGNGDTLSTSCFGCTVGDDSTCRAGETCARATGGGLPFPLPGFGTGPRCVAR